MFKDRKDAGERLARSLEKYKGKDAIILAIPRGGVEVGFEAAKYLNLDFSILISRKLPFPDNPEAGFGAAAEDGSIFVFEHAKRWLTAEDIERIIDEQKKEIKRRVAVLRKNETVPGIKGRTVILVDDGIAMGSTMRAAIMFCKNRSAGRIVVAVPVSAQQAEDEFRALADEVVILEKPPFFSAVAQVYKNWYDVADEEVIEIMDKVKGHKVKGIK